MDGDRFDHLTRSLRTRRTALGGLLGTGLAVLLGVAAPGEAAAHDRVPACRRIQNLQRRRRCLRQARAHNWQHQQCEPQSAATTCAGRCGVWRNNCKEPVTCPACPTGRSCIDNGSCAHACPLDACPSGCWCEASLGATPTANPALCHNFAGSGACSQQPCASTTECPLDHACFSTGCSPVAGRCLPLCKS